MLQRRPQREGLYDPRFEHDACGVGFVCQIDGTPSHRIVRDGLAMLVNLDHRGACGCDEETGDGAGLLLQLPHRFFAQEAARLGFALPPPGAYGAGMVFLPTDDEANAQCRQTIERIIHEEGQTVLGWRGVPTRPALIGEAARTRMPVIAQVFVGQAGEIEAGAFERRLYVIRKRIERAVEEADLADKSCCYVCSLSGQTISYKGMLTTAQLSVFYPDFEDPAFESALAMVHSRFSTNTLPQWRLAQPFRYLSHNGEINTLRGNINWMNARQRLFESPLFGDDMAKLLPVLEEGGSDSATLDQAVELLCLAGRSLPHVMMMLIPEAWQHDPAMRGEKRAFYQYHACLMEPWDGPATVPFTDGRYIGAVLDRNGLRPSRYTVTHDGIVMLASETGVLPVDPANVAQKGRLQPGKMFLVDLHEGRIISDEEIKGRMSRRRPYQQWLDEHQFRISDLAPAAAPPPVEDGLKRQRLFGYTLEDHRILLGPMAENGKEALGSMGDDTPLAVLSDRPRLLYDYFKQLFAQVTNPPLDAIREELVTSLSGALGAEPNLLEETPAHAHQIVLAQPVLTDEALARIRRHDDGLLRAITLPILFDLAHGGGLNGFSKAASDPSLETRGRARLMSEANKGGRAGGEVGGCSSGAESDRSDEIATLEATVQARPSTHPQSLRDSPLKGAVASTLSRLGCSLKSALDALCRAAEAAVEAGATILILSDRDADARRAPIPALLATAAVHHHLIRKGLRTQCGLIVESGEPREVHHFALLLGYGVTAVNPYLALQVVREAAEDAEGAVKNYIKAVGKGLLKVMSKMGISTLQSYQGAQIFEAVGLSSALVEAYFTGTPSRLEGIGLDVVAEEARLRHATAYPEVEEAHAPALDVGGRYLWRRGGEHHLFNPLTIAHLQESVRTARYETYAEYARLINDQTRRLGTLRGLLDFREATPVPLDEVEPWTEIVKRFKTGAMSYGSISQETHETLAVAMNEIGGKSNTGEGGEDPSRYSRQSPRRSRIKQVASGRFGVTIGYLTSADEIQIKIAQGAKPGEGGQLPSEKVYPWIARTRHSTPYVGLISPPPHHDIYSIEDLAQLIHDLKNANPAARICVKLVSEVGVGTIAAGVAKGKADLVLISGNDGGTGASPQTSVMHTGLPWELGLAETHQTLVRNGLRSRIRVECDGQLKTGRDVAVAALLGADEFGFATAPLVAMGCIMMRKCHLNTCPVGIATQNPELRKRFAGTPEHVVNYFHFVAEELRQLMAQLGFRTVEEMVGQVERLAVRDDIDHWKARHLDLTPILAKPTMPPRLAAFQTDEQDHGLDGALDHFLIEQAAPVLEAAIPVEISLDLRNTHRTVGTMLSARVTERYGEDGLPEDSIVLRGRGSAGQSFFAFGAPGLTAHLEGDANDYFGKGLSGARLVIRPPHASTFTPEENIIIGNVALYGATRGEAYIRGQAGERFAVRNSGAHAVVEGVGDHGCEYMTGGRVVVLGPTGRNFAAGMSGGVAYVLDGTWDFRRGRCNTEMVEIEPVEDAEDIAELRNLVERHAWYTESSVARWVLDNWDYALGEFVKVMPVEYKRALRRLETDTQAASAPAMEMVAA